MKSLPWSFALELILFPYLYRKAAAESHCDYDQKLYAVLQTIFIRGKFI